MSSVLKVHHELGEDVEVREEDGLVTAAVLIPIQQPRMANTPELIRSSITVWLGGRFGGSCLMSI